MRKTDGTQDTLVSIQKRRRVPASSPAVPICEGALAPQQFKKTRGSSTTRRWHAATGTWVALTTVRDPSYSDVDNPIEAAPAESARYFS